MTATHPVCNRCPFAQAILNEADKLWPTRNKASDGVCSGDPAHWDDPTTDHNPSGPNHYAHADDVTHDPAHGADMGRAAVAIAGRMRSGQERRVKYLVFNFGGADMICENGIWEQNGNYKTEHRTHLHISFYPSAEQSTASFFGDGSWSLPTPATGKEEPVAVVQPGKTAVPSGRTCIAVLNVSGRCVELWNGAAIKYDAASTTKYKRIWRLGANAHTSSPKLNGVPLGMAEADPKRPGGPGVVVLMSDGGTVDGYWS